MARRTSKPPTAYGYVARPRKSRTKDGVEESYWTVRCRRQGEMGEWSLGWFSSNRQAEYAFHAWVEKHRAAPAPNDGSALLADVIGRYIAMVETMGKRPKTRENRIFRAKKLLAFVQSTNSAMAIGDFDDSMFEQYLDWLDAVIGHKPNTTENALIGARTLLRWAQAQGLVTRPPKVPEFRVPPPQHDVLYAEDVDATIAHAVPPLDVMLRLLWETGMRVSEAATTRGCDLRQEERLVVVQEREFDGAMFVPKTDDSARSVPVTAELMADLVRLVTAPEAGLFPCPVGGIYHYWRHRMTKAQKAAGVRPFTFHAIRRAVADRLRKGKVQIDHYARLMGHAPITAIRHYSVVTTDDLHEALDAGLGAARRRSGTPSRSNAGASEEA